MRIFAPGVTRLIPLESAKTPKIATWSPITYTWGDERDTLLEAIHADP